MSKPVFKTTGRKGTDEFVIEFPAGTYVFREGDLGPEMYIVQEGSVEIIKEVDEGEEKQLAVLEKGDFFGEMSLLEELPRAASARAVTELRLLQINGATFDRMLQSNPEIAVRMMRKMARRLRHADAMLREALAGSGQEPESPSEVPAPDTHEPAAAPERLIHIPSGMEFPLSGGAETTLGRRDPVTGIYPDVDLTPIDSQRSISRRHAKIYRRGSKFFLSEEIGTMNATFLNGTRLDTGIPQELKPTDEIRLGVVLLRLEVP